MCVCVCVSHLYDIMAYPSSGMPPSSVPTTLKSAYTNLVQPCSTSDENCIWACTCAANKNQPHAQTCTHQRLPNSIALLACHRHCAMHVQCVSVLCVRVCVCVCVRCLSPHRPVRTCHCSDKESSLDGLS